MTTDTRTHTPGPWRALIWEEYVAPTGNRIVTQDGFEIAALSYTGGSEDADARLIAAAPDLKEVLIQAIEESGFSVSGPTDWRAAEDGEPHWVCKAREILARA